MKNKPLLSLRDFFVFIFCFIVPVFWIVCLLVPKAPLVYSGRTELALHQTENAIQSFIDTNGEVPQSLSEIRAFAKTKKIPLMTFDVYGQRFQYIRLDPQNFLLRSFGADGLQNTLLRDRDAGLFKVKGKKLRRGGLLHKFSSYNIMRFYPAVLLMGATSPNQMWIAQLFVDRKSGVKQLIVRNREKNDFFLVAPHDAVEEFFWYPDGHTVIFSATSSKRYKDGIYAWNLIDDSLSNIIDAADFRLQLEELSKEENYYISLAGIDIQGPTLYAYVSPRNENVLNPTYFFSPRCLMLFEFNEASKQIIIKKGSSLPQNYAMLSHITRKNVLDGLLNLREPLLEVYSEGARDQRQWLDLPVTGPLEPALMMWQKMSEKLSDTPLFPYSLWYLSIFYAESFKNLDIKGKKDLKQDMEILRSYAAELAGALVKLDTAPAYLRGLSVFAYDKLSQSEYLPYHISSLERK